MQWRKRGKSLKFYIAAQIRRPNALKKKGFEMPKGDRQTHEDLMWHKPKWGQPIKTMLIAWILSENQQEETEVGTWIYIYICMFVSFIFVVWNAWCGRDMANKHWSKRNLLKNINVKLNNLIYKIWWEICKADKAT